MSHQQQEQLLAHPVGKIMSFLAFKTLYRLNEKPRAPEIKVLTKKPAKVVIKKFDDVSMNIQQTIRDYMKSRDKMKDFKDTLGKRRKELNDEEESVRDELVNHLKTKKDMQDKVELPKSKRPREESAAAPATKAKAGDGGDDDDDKSDADTIIDFLNMDMDEYYNEDTAPAATAASAATAATAADSTPEDDGDDVSDTASTTYSVAIEARKRSTGKITPLEFKDILIGCISHVLDESFHLKDTEHVTKEMVKRIYESNLFWSNLFSKVTHVITAEQASRVDDKLVLYIRDQKKKKTGKP